MLFRMSALSGLCIAIVTCAECTEKEREDEEESRREEQREGGREGGRERGRIRGDNDTALPSVMKNCLV